MNCHACIYRGSVPGDSHSCCNHPIVKDGYTSVMALMCGMMNMQSKSKYFFDPLKIEADTHGYAMGWFEWPLNFDPVWLKNCEGFTEKE